LPLHLYAAWAWLWKHQILSLVVLINAYIRL
jgi:hypothetical protein